MATWQRSSNGSLVSAKRRATARASHAARSTIVARSAGSRVFENSATAPSIESGAKRWSVIQCLRMAVLAHGCSGACAVRADGFSAVRPRRPYHSLPTLKPRRCVGRWECEVSTDRRRRRGERGTDVATRRAPLVVCRRRIHHDTAKAAVAATLSDAWAADKRRSRRVRSAASPRPDAIAGTVLSRPRPISGRAAVAVEPVPGADRGHHALVQKPIGRSVNVGWMGWPSNSCARRARSAGSRGRAWSPLGGAVERLAGGDGLDDRFERRLMARELPSRSRRTQFSISMFGLLAAGYEDVRRRPQ